MNTARPLSTLTRAGLQQRLGSTGVRLRVAPFVVHIHSPIPVVAEGLHALYADHEWLDDDGFADFHVAVQPRRRWFRPLCVFELDGTAPFTPLAYGEAFAFLEWGLNWCVTGHCHTLLTIHSAVLEKKGRVLVMPAPAGSGKSTLCAALMLHGWRLLSDEMALLDPLTGHLVPAPRPVSLKNQSIDVVRRLAPDAVIGPVARDTLKGTVAHLRVSPDSLARAGVSAPPAWVVFPRFEREASLSVEPRPKARALVDLASNSFNQHVHGRAGFEALAHLIDRSQCFSLRYGHLPEALAWFDALEADA